MQNIKSMSFLLSKYVDKINPATTGWVRPDGVINFANKDAAKNYAVNICISANKQYNVFKLVHLKSFFIKNVTLSPFLN